MKRIFALLLLFSPAVQAIVIDNGIPEDTVGHFSVDVLAGGDTRDATITARRFDTGALTTTDVVFDYFSFVDPGQDGGGIRLSASADLVGPTLDLLDPDDPNTVTVTSSGTFSGQFGEVSWTATSSIRPRSQLMTTRYAFVATGDDPIGTLRVLQYLDEDVKENPDDDVFLPRGLADSGNLSLYTFGNSEVIGVRQAGLESSESFFAGWAAAPFRDLLDRILGDGQPIAREGVNDLPLIDHPQLGPSFGPADITSVLAWDINPNTFFAEVITVLGGEDAAPDSEPEPDPRPDTPEADLSIMMSGSPNPATAGEPLIYTLTVQNDGPNPAEMVGVTVHLPRDVAPGRATATGGTCLAFPTVFCRLGPLQNGDSAVVTIEVTPLEAGTAMSRATVNVLTYESDPTDDNNVAMETITVNLAQAPKADLMLTMADAPDPGAVGERLTYTVTVTNNGPATATGVRVTDSLPPAVVLGAPTGNCRGNPVVVCELGTLASGASAIVPIDVIPTVAGAVTNEVLVNSSVNDNVSGNNRVSVITVVNTSPLMLPPQGRQNRCTDRGCDVRLTCTLGTTCTNRVTLSARIPSGRLASGASAKAARTIPFAFASATNVPPGQTMNVRLQFTKRGRQIVRQLITNGTRRLNGRIDITRSVVGAGVSSVPATVRLKSRR